LAYVISPNKSTIKPLQRDPFLPASMFRSRYRVPTLCQRLSLSDLQAKCSMQALPNLLQKKPTVWAQVISLISLSHTSWFCL